MSKASDLKQHRLDLIQKATSILETVEKEQRGFSDEEEKNYNTWTNEAESLREQILVAERREWLSEQEIEAKKIERKVKPLSLQERQQGNADYNAAVTSFFRGGSRLSDQERENCALCGIDPMARDIWIKPQSTRDLVKSVQTDWIPETFSDQIENKLATYGNVYSIARKFNTDHGNIVNLALNDNTANAAQIVEEGADYPEITPTASKVQLIAKKFATCIQVSREFVEDASFAPQLQSWIVDQLGEALSRGYESYLATGTGTNQPQGVVTGSALGVSAPALSYEVFVRLIGSVDPLYLNKGGNVGFMMHNLSRVETALLMDGNDRPLLQSAVESMADGIRGTILGYPVYSNNFMDTATAGVFTPTDKPILFGNFSTYTCRFVRSIYVQRLTELNAKKGLLDYLIDVRLDGRYTSHAGTVKHWVVSA